MGLWCNWTQSGISNCNLVSATMESYWERKTYERENLDYLGGNWLKIILTQDTATAMSGQWWQHRLSMELLPNRQAAGPGSVSLEVLLPSSKPPGTRQCARRPPPTGTRRARRRSPPARRAPACLCRPAGCSCGGIERCLATWSIWNKCCLNQLSWVRNPNTEVHLILIHCLFC